MINSNDDFITKEEAIFYSKRSIASLFKQFLYILENFKSDHDINHAKLMKALPKEYENLIEMYDFFCQQRFAKIRKQILDIGNESARNLETDLKNL